MRRRLFSGQPSSYSPPWEPQILLQDAFQTWLTLRFRQVLYSPFDEINEAVTNVALKHSSPCSLSIVYIT
jgi:hypothetical protein